METVENKRFVYEFGKFLLDPNEKTLFVNGEPIHLPAKEFETLLLLVENNGRALSKEEMMAAVWQDAFVEESNLAKQISRLRKTLDTNGEQYIETLPKHGYRFSAVLHHTIPQAEQPVILEKRTVNRLTVELGKSEDDLPPVPLLGSGKRFWTPWKAVAGIMAAVALIGLIWFWMGRSQPASKIDSVAVLPFKSVTADQSDDNLRIGLTDALITKLGDLKQLVVRPTNAIRKYDSQDPLAAGRELGVDAVLDGNVQRVAQQIRVTVQLVDVRDGRLLWGGRFDEQVADAFRLQDEIAEQVAAALALRLTGEDKRLITKRYTANPEAHYAYVRGRIAWNRRTSEDFLEAIKYFEEAIAKDPNYALAYAGLADSCSLLADYRAAEQKESYEKARDAALKALELDDNLAEAHTSLAYANMYYFWDWQRAESDYKRAIALNPNYATAHQWYSEYLAGQGRFDEALAEIRRAKEIDPLSSVINAGEVWILYYARRYDEAIEHGRRLADMNPQFAEVHEYLKRCYDQKGMFRDAISARQMRRKLAGLDPTETEPIRRAANATDTSAYWKGRLDQEIADAQKEPPSSFDMAEIYAQLGDKDKAFAWLEKSFEERTYTMMYLKVAPNLDPLRSDPRFADLLKRVGLAF